MTAARTVSLASSDQTSWMRLYKKLSWLPITPAKASRSMLCACKVVGARQHVIDYCIVRIQCEVRLLGDLLFKWAAVQSAAAEDESLKVQDSASLIETWTDAMHSRRCLPE